MTHKTHKEEVICPNCCHVQTESNLLKGDKFAWKCNNCSAMIEDGKLHLLQRDARFCFPRNGGGNICTSFGGLAGEVFHKVYDEQ